MVSRGECKLVVKAIFLLCKRSPEDGVSESPEPGRYLGLGRQRSGCQSLGRIQWYTELRPPQRLCSQKHVARLWRAICSCWSHQICTWWNHVHRSAFCLCVTPSVATLMHMTVVIWGVIWGLQQCSESLKLFMEISGADLIQGLGWTPCQSFKSHEGPANLKRLRSLLHHCAWRKICHFLSGIFCTVNSQCFMRGYAEKKLYITKSQDLLLQDLSFFKNCSRHWKHKNQLVRLLWAHKHFHSL